MARAISRALRLLRPHSLGCRRDHLVRRRTLFIIPSGQGSARRRASTLTSDGVSRVRDGERGRPRTKVEKIITSILMGYMQEFEADLRKVLATGETEAIVRW